MLKLSNEIFVQVSFSIKEFSRDLEKFLYEYYFEEGSSENIVKELKRYQNEDGGFGNAIESDFRLPNSSPMGTSIGIRILSEIEETKEIKNIIKSAIGYLESTFNKNRNGWYALTKEVNNHHHTPWWHYSEEEGRCYLYEKLGYVKTGKFKKITELMTIVDFEKVINK